MRFLQQRTAAPQPTPAGGVMDWSREQQQQLQGAIKQFATYKGADKWEKVAELVSGKTKEQCVERVKYLRDVASKSK